jgi:hypothetical protein
MSSNSPSSGHIYNQNWPSSPLMHISSACPGGTPPGQPRGNEGEFGILSVYSAREPRRNYKLRNNRMMGGGEVGGLWHDNLNFINEVHNWCELKIAGSQRKISIANLLFMIFCSGLAKIWINKYRIHECHCDTPVCMIIFNCLYAIYIIWTILSRGRAVWLAHFPGERGVINALESCFFKVPGCPGGVPPGQAVDMRINPQFIHYIDWWILIW